MSIFPRASDATDEHHRPRSDESPFDVVRDFSLAAERRPEAIALRAPGEVVSYRELDERSARVASQLRDADVGAETLVAICIDRSIEHVVAVLAVWKAGGAYLALDPAWPDRRLRDIVADARCAVLLCRADDARWTEGGAPAAAVGDGLCMVAQAARDEPCPAPGADPLAYVVYTSGSTGAPKGVEITRANLASLIAWHRDAFAVTAGDRASQLAGLGFDASIWEVWPYLCAGASVSIVDEATRTSPERLRDWLLAGGISIAFVPTGLVERLVGLDWPADGALRFLLTGGERLGVVPRAGLPFVLVNNYGPSECTVVATSGIVLPDPAAAGPPTIGRPIGDTCIHILDDRGALLPPGEVGEMHIGGPGVARGYRGQPALTAARFVAGTNGGTLYRSGDFGAVRADGQISFHGRVDDQVKIRGHRVEPAETADVIRRHDMVADAVVVARAGGEAADQLVAYVVLAPGAVVTADAMRDHVAARLPDFMLPAAFVRLDALPLGANGKLDRPALPVPGRGNALPAPGFSAPSTAVEARLVAILDEVIGSGGIGIDDNFFLIGLHSLVGTQVVMRASDAFGIDLTLRDLFQSPTVRQLAVVVEDQVMRLVAAMSDDEVRLRAAE